MISKNLTPRNLIISTIKIFTSFANICVGQSFCSTLGGNNGHLRNVLKMYSPQDLLPENKLRPGYVNLKKKISIIKYFLNLNKKNVFRP